MKAPKITVEDFYVENASSLGLRLLAGSGGLKRVIKEPTVNRPGLALAGFTKYFANKRVQTVGSAEVTYLKSLPQEERVARFEDICRHKIPGVVFSRNLKPENEFLKVAEKMDIPVFRSPLITMKFIKHFGTVPDKFNILLNKLLLIVWEFQHRFRLFGGDIE